MADVLGDGGVGRVWAAPMAGGPSTPALVVAAAEAGGVGFLAGGYKTPAALRDEIRAVRGSRPDVPFGVNLFAPNSVPVDPDAYRAYAEEIAADAAAVGVDARAVPLREDDDAWVAKLALLAEERPPLVSFTFGLPEPAVFAELHGRGIVAGQTVTDEDEADAALAAGARFLVAQTTAAGGHHGAFDPARPASDRALPELVRALAGRADVPVIGAGGIGTAADVAAALGAGARAVSVGTMLLLADEAGTAAPYRRALAERRYAGTAVTRAFSGRPARGLRNGWIDRHPDAPSGYPAIHHLTAPVRRAAAAADDADRMALWAGTGFAHTRSGPAAGILHALDPRG
jgi:nitronate monooxygenase